MSDLTPETLAELRRLLDAATPGPWRDEMMQGKGVTLTAIIAGRPNPDDLRVIGSTLAHNDARVLIAAVNALPALLDAAAERDALAEVPALLAERDALAAKLGAVRALHGPRVLQVLGATCFAEECDHEDACPLVDYTVCGHCYDVGDGAHPYAYEEGGLQDIAHPCATRRALDATPDTGGES